MILEKDISDYQMETEISEDVNRIIDWVHKQIRDRDKISKWIRTFDLSLEDIVKKNICSNWIREKFIYCLKDVDILRTAGKPGI